MFGYRLRTLVFGTLGLFIVTVLTLLATAPSWSQTALTSFGYLLTAGLLFIASSFGERAVAHPEKNRTFFKLFKKPVRLEHLSRFTQIMFFAIIVFPVTQVEAFPDKVNAINKIIDFIHYPVTGLAILGVTLEMLFWYKKWTKNWWINVIAIGLAVTYFILEVTVGLISIAAGELAIAYAGFGHIIKTNHK